ncbi:MAG: hypothetical protein SOV02_09140 [Streptococcus infantarius]|uniref:hypothetical protein n=1 Tax=Streptococcus infantarius TaxID=102684 RepID=UPI002A7B1990|nr:hypothetical protein [Streptococcus infantarius]
MAEMNQNDKKLLAVADQVSELLLAYKYDEAWEAVGELNALLKKEDYSLPEEVLETMRKNVKSYYYQETQVIRQAHRVMSAIGHSLAEVSN